MLAIRKTTHNFPFTFKSTFFQAIVVFGCISSQGWRLDSLSGKDICILNKDDTACNFPVLIGVFGFLASMAFIVGKFITYSVCCQEIYLLNIVGEYLFEQMSSVKTRKHYVLVDLGFSGDIIILIKNLFLMIYFSTHLALWSFMFFIVFCYLCSAWSKAEAPPGTIYYNKYCVINNY